MNKKGWVLVIVVVGMVGGSWRWFRSRKTGEAVYQEIAVVRDTLRQDIQMTGVVQPQNRVEIIPIMAGRIEKLLVDEGDRVNKGQILAWTSSNERAALLDAAAAQGPEEVKRWEEIYKPLPLVAPINGTIIARNMEPGQRIVSTAPVFVMSNQLIVKAQVDETDVGRVALGQDAWVTLDAFPRDRVKARVDRIAHEAKTVSNVTIYEVDVRPDRLPPFFRSGMTGTVVIVVNERPDVLVVPAAAVIDRNDGKGVWVKTGARAVEAVTKASPPRERHGGRRGPRSRPEGDRAPEPRAGGRPTVRLTLKEGSTPEAVPGLARYQPVKLGATDNKRVEVTEGLAGGEVVLVPDGGMPWMQQNDGTTSPFGGFGGARRQGGGPRR